MTPEPIELKLCPFCGKPPEVTTQGSFKKVMCENWECRIIVETVNDPEQCGVDAWNTRAPSELDSLRADLQAAKNRDAYRENLVTELRNERSVLRDENATQAAELTRLRALIESAKVGLIKAKKENELRFSPSAILTAFETAISTLTP